jgi:hypothetical protein
MEAGLRRGRKTLPESPHQLVAMLGSLVNILTLFSRP